MLPMPTLRHVADFDVELDSITEMGDGRGGRRRIIPIVGGRVSGPCFSGEIMNVGADWQTVFSSGLAELDTRYAFRTDDGAVIEITNFGFRHGSPDVMRQVAAGEVSTIFILHAHAKLKPGIPSMNGSTGHCSSALAQIEVGCQIISLCY